MKLFASALLAAQICAAQGPLTLASQGSFFVGGEYKTMPATPGRGGAPGAAGEITINQMYVQYQIPVKGAQHVPVVMVHGCCLSSKTWETTPDGRMGWSEYFVRKDRSVYMADQSSRARSGFDPSTARSSPDARRNSILDCEMRILTGVVNCWRMEAADSAEDAVA